MKKMISFVVVNFAIIAFFNWLVLWIIHPMWAESWIKIGFIYGMQGTCLSMRQ